MKTPAGNEAYTHSHWFILRKDKGFSWERSEEEEGNAKTKDRDRRRWSGRVGRGSPSLKKACLSRWAGWANKLFKRSNTKAFSISTMVTWQKATSLLDDFPSWRGRSPWDSYFHFITCLIVDKKRTYSYKTVFWNLTRTRGWTGKPTQKKSGLDFVKNPIFRNPQKPAKTH